MAALAREARENGYVVTLAILPDGRYVRTDISPDLLADEGRAAAAVVAQSWSRLMAGPPPESGE